MVRSTARRTALALTLSLMACDEALGPGQGQGSLSVRLSRDDGATAAAALVAANLVEATMGPLPLEAVASIDVTITAVQVQREGEDEETGPWVTLDLVAPATVDLLALPTDGGEGLLVATDEVDVGSYGHLRLLFSDASITLAEDVTLAGTTFTAGTAYELTIPSGAQTGIKVQLGGIEVPDGGAAEVELLFDAATSVGNVLVTGNGIQMTPVLHVAGE